MTSSIVFIIATFPIGSLLIYPLETHFSTKPILPEKVDGIILLVGSFIPSSSQAWKKAQTNQYPSAKAIFTGKANHWLPNQC